MNHILEKEYFSANVVKLVVSAPEVAKARKPGHFVIVRCGEGGERIPLTIADSDSEKGTLTLVVQAVGESTRKICALEAGDELTDLVGPLRTSNRYRSPRRYGCLLWRWCRRGPVAAYHQGHEASRKPRGERARCSKQRPHNT